MTSHLVLPVVHYKDSETAVAQATLALNLGADGIFLISHSGSNRALYKPATILKNVFPDKLVGLNLLGESALTALDEVQHLELDMVWTDTPGVSSKGLTAEGLLLEEKLARMSRKPLFFGSVAFKYQPVEPQPGTAAQRAAKAGMLPTTSGSATGAPPSVEKAREMKEAVNDGPLAVASGMTPENVADYLPYFSHYLVATGVSLDEHHFDATRLKQFVATVHSARSSSK